MRQGANGWQGANRWQSSEWGQRAKRPKVVAPPQMLQQLRRAREANNAAGIGSYNAFPTTPPPHSEPSPFLGEYGDGCPTTSCRPPALQFPQVAGMGVVVPPPAVNIANVSRCEMIAEDNGFELAHEAVNGSNLQYLQQQMHMQVAAILQIAAQRHDMHQIVQQQQQQIMSLQMQCNQLDREPTTHALYMQTRNCIHIQCILICKMQQVYPLYESSLSITIVLRIQ